MRPPSRPGHRFLPLLVLLAVLPLACGEPGPADPVPPNAPAGVVVVTLGETTVTIGWMDQSDDEEGFIIRRGTGGTAIAEVGSVGAGATSFEDAGLSSGTDYTWAVCAFNDAGTSGCPAVTARTLEPPAVALSAESAAFDGTAGGPAPPSQVIDVSNAGDGTLGDLVAVVTYGEGEPEDWLTATLAATTAPTTLTLTASTGIPAGTHSATVTVSSPDAAEDAVVAVTHTLEAPPSGWVALPGSPFSPHDARFVRVSANASDVVVFYGFDDPALPILEQAEVVRWNDAFGWTGSLYQTNSAWVHPDVVAMENGFAVIYNNDGLDVGGAVVDHTGTYGLGRTILENQNEPAIGVGLGTAWAAYIVAGRGHMRYSLAHAGTTDYPELTGTLGQTSGTSLCVLTLDCILDTAVAGTDQHWYLAVVEKAGCFSVMRGSATSTTWLTPCVAASGDPRDIQLHVRDGALTVIFREDAGTSLYVAEWDGTNWIILGAVAISANAVVRSVADGEDLLVAVMDPAAANLLLVDRYDGASWTGHPPEGILGSGALVSDMDLAILDGQPVIAVIENDRPVVRRFVPPLDGAVALAPGLIRGAPQATLRAP